MIATHSPVDLKYSVTAEITRSERRGIARKYNKAFEKSPLICPTSLDDDYVAHLLAISTIRSMSAN
jgi:hypothetical protein